MCNVGPARKLFDLDQMEPGPQLAVTLGKLRMEALSPDQRVVVMKAQQRLASHYQAQTYQSMASISDSMHEDLDGDVELAHLAAAAEIRCALHLTRRAADCDLDLALDLCKRLPQVFKALEGGEIDLRRARVIVSGTSHMSDEIARLVVDQIIEQAKRMTTGQINALLRKMCVQVDPFEAQARYEQAVDERRVVLEPTNAGTANILGFDLPPERAQAVMNKINQLAQGLRQGDETRTMDQLRADVFLDLLDGQNHRKNSRRGVVDIQVNLETLTHLSEEPGELAGYGPVIADIARQVAENRTDSEWRWTVTDPNTGMVIHNGITRRRPTTGLRRHVEARNQTCIFPGCRMPAIDCDLDHRIPWAQGGLTTPKQMVPACRHDHILKDGLGWKHRALPNGDHIWTSRLGHTYTTSGAPP